MEGEPRQGPLRPQRAFDFLCWTVCEFITPVQTELPTDTNTAVTGIHRDVLTEEEATSGKNHPVV